MQKRHSASMYHPSYSNYQKKMPQQQNNSEKKTMSSSFFLYKIHGKNNEDLSSNASNLKPRVVKTSGGMRQKHISEEIKYFTRNKINP